MSRRRAKRRRNRPTLTKPPLPIGGAEVVGEADLFRFPFEIFHECSEPVDTQYGHARVVVYPPFPADGRANRVIEQVDLRHIPRPPGTVDPSIGAPTIDQWGPGPIWPSALRGNALRVDRYGSADTLGLVDLLLDLIRVSTYQWWVTRDHRHDEGYYTNTFKINALGERVGGCAVNGKITGLTRLERPLKQREFTQLVQLACRGATPPLFLLLFCDATYYLMTGDYRRFSLEAGVACETLLRSEAIRAAQVTQVPDDRRRAFEGYRKVKQRIDAISNLFDIALPDEPHPACALWLKALWDARNAAAHGGTAEIRFPGEPPRRPSAKDYFSMHRAMRQLILWQQDRCGFSFVAKESRDLTSH